MLSLLQRFIIIICTVYPKKYTHGICFAVLCCGYTLTDFPISIRLTSLALWQSNDCHSANKATLMNMDKYFMWNHYERLHNHNKAKHNKTVCIFLGIYCMSLKWRHLNILASQSPATWIFAQNIDLIDNNINIADPHYFPFVSKIYPVTGGSPSQRAS